MRHAVVGVIGAVAAALSLFAGAAQAQTTGALTPLNCISTTGISGCLSQPA